MPAFIALALVTVLAVVVLSIAVHILFSPWLLVAVAIVLLIKFRPRHSRQ
jgi:predicted membrane chloride channel (bestrophin family)